MKRKWKVKMVIDGITKHEATFSASTAREAFDIFLGFYSWSTKGTEGFSISVIKVD